MRIWFCIWIVTIPALAYWSYVDWRKGFDREILLPPPSANAVAEGEKEKKYDLEKIENLFGRPDNSPPPPVVVKESTLAIKLLASYIGAKEGRSAAVVSVNGKNERLHYQGDVVLPGVELVAVQERRILIKRNGVLESVTLDDKSDPSDKKAPVAKVMPQPVIADASPPMSVPLVKAMSHDKMAARLSQLKALANGEK